MAVDIITTEMRDKSLIKDFVIADKIKAGIMPEDFIKLWNDGAKFEGFIGFVEKPKSFLGEVVPESFINSRIVEYNDDGDSIDISKKWSEYCHFFDIGNSKVLLKIGWIGKSGNRPDVVKHDELKCWVDYFGLDNIILKNQGKEIINDFNKKMEEL